MAPLRIAVSLLVAFAMVEGSAHAGGRQAGNGTSKAVAGRYRKVKGNGHSTLVIVDLGAGRLRIDAYDASGEPHWPSQVVDGIGDAPTQSHWSHGRLRGGRGTEKTTTTALTEGARRVIRQLVIEDEHPGLIDIVRGDRAERTVEKLTLAVTDQGNLEVRRTHDTYAPRFRLFGPLTRRVAWTDRQSAITEYVRLAENPDE